MATELQNAVLKIQDPSTGEWREVVADVVGYFPVAAMLRTRSSAEEKRWRRDCRPDGMSQSHWRKVWRERDLGRAFRDCAQ
ncbi:MAG TPA: hypothetical protein VGD45_20475 [Steroidobacter sp.]|uniref:hypothetical protein n=1 Tax=Steroidobacter sp. TaxID=1978227 RepID=UPI002EDAB8A6